MAAVPPDQRLDMLAPGVPHPGYQSRDGNGPYVVQARIRGGNIADDTFRIAERHRLS
jgi:hypothetical protein